MYDNNITQTERMDGSYGCIMSGAMVSKIITEQQIKTLYPLNWSKAANIKQIEKGFQWCDIKTAVGEFFCISFILFSLKLYKRKENIDIYVNA